MILLRGEINRFRTIPTRTKHQYPRPPRFISRWSFYIYTTPQKGGIPIGFYIGIMLLNIYISQHGDELNFLDVSLITTAVCIVIGMVITLGQSNDKH